MINIEDYKIFFERTLSHNFDNDNSILLFEDFKLNNSCVFGFNRFKNLVIILPQEIYQSNVGIDNVCILKSPMEYNSVLDKSFKIFGCPLTYYSDDLDEQFQLLNHIDDLLLLEDYGNQINNFLNILENIRFRASSKFNSSGFFAEVCTVLFLKKKFPKIADHWIGTRKTTFDIKSSPENPFIEIKSTLNIDAREHKLSINQIQFFKDNKDAELASLIVSKDDVNGKSCNEICKLLLSELSKHEIGYQNLFNIILYYARNADFNNDLYDFEKTTKSIKFFKPDFSDLKLDPQPLWLTGGVLNIDFDLIKNLGSIIL